MKKYIIIFLICLLLVVNGVFILYAAQKVRSYGEQVQGLEQQSKFLKFRNLFVESVLLAEGEIDSDVRWELENSVRALNDSEIFKAWSAFVESEDEKSAELYAKDLLRLLIKRTTPK